MDDDHDIRALKAYYDPPRTMDERRTEAEAFSRACLALLPTIYPTVALAYNVVPFPAHRRR